MSGARCEDRDDEVEDEEDVERGWVDVTGGVGVTVRQSRVLPFFAVHAIVLGTGIPVGLGWVAVEATDGAVVVLEPIGGDLLRVEVGEDLAADVLEEFGTHVELFAVVVEEKEDIEGAVAVEPHDHGDVLLLKAIVGDAVRSVVTEDVDKAVTQTPVFDVGFHDVAPMVRGTLRWGRRFPCGM